MIRARYPSVFLGLKTLITPLFRPYRVARQRLKDWKKSQWQKSIISSEAGKITKVRDKEILRILFVVIHRSTWKTDTLYNILKEDPKFSPCIIVAPGTINPPELSKIEQNEAFKSFSGKGYEVYLGSLKDDENRVLIREIGPDIVIFNNPHKLVCPSLREFLLKNYLSCYIPYHIEVGNYGGNIAQYNQDFHNAMWKIFSPHVVSKNTYNQVADRKGENVVVTGYPGLEVLVSGDKSEHDPWKKLGLKRIIWAPHHTIDSPSLPYSNFLRYAEFFRDAVDKYSNEVQWCFKPHPLLKAKLFEHFDWGHARTEEYFDFWENQTNTQIEQGEYNSLFQSSDAMIHDSGSFLAEYIYVNKPVMYLWSSNQLPDFFNRFGSDALDACQRGNNATNIHEFISSVIEGRDIGQLARQAFLENNPVKVSGMLPSERIVLELKREIFE
ncbi:CDP-glycerol glycerophosphotransferase family protein [Amylibacter sp.]|nr:CDP-glycerol glycerophosphotransferase family protein [Amylibacter sp.]